MENLDTIDSEKSVSESTTLKFASILKNVNQLKLVKNAIPKTARNTIQKKVADLEMNVPITTE